MSNKQVYVVTMHRGGDAEAHNYLIGVFGNEQRARSAAKIEQDWRGGKYEPRIERITLNEMHAGAEKNHPRNVVLDLPDQRPHMARLIRTARQKPPNSPIKGTKDRSC